MLLTIIHDSLGFDSGIKVTNVRSVLDKEKDCIFISGRMSGEHFVGLDLEPDIQCDVVNKEDQICLSAVSAHQGVYSVTKRVTFTIHVDSVSQSIRWDDIERINLYVIFRRI